MQRYKASAFWTERDQALAYFRQLTEAEWEAPSRAAGWRVRDVVAHLGSTCRTLTSLKARRYLRDIHTRNEELVNTRRDWPLHKILREYERASARLIKALQLPGRHDIWFNVPHPVLGHYPLELLPSALLFDWHTHLRHDITPALNHPTPPTNFDRMYEILPWIMHWVEHINPNTLNWKYDAIRLELEGHTGGTWKIWPTNEGRLTVSQGSWGPYSLASIAGHDIDLPSWTTHRTNWRDHNLTLEGDTDLATRFLDTIKIS